MGHSSVTLRKGVPPVGWALKTIFQKKTVTSSTLLALWRGWVGVKFPEKNFNGLLREV